MAVLAVATAGAAIGSFFGAPQVGWLVGSLVGAALFGGGQQQKSEGPRLGDLQVQASTYGSGIPQIFGAIRLAGNVIWARPLIEKRRKESAGKGGGGQTVVSYEYFATFAVSFARGPVDANQVSSALTTPDLIVVGPNSPRAADRTLRGGHEPRRLAHARGRHDANEERRASCVPCECARSSDFPMASGKRDRQRPPEVLRDR